MPLTPLILILMAEGPLWKKHDGSVWCGTHTYPSSHVVRDCIRIDRSAPKPAAPKPAPAPPPPAGGCVHRHLIILHVFGIVCVSHVHMVRLFLYD